MSELSERYTQIKPGFDPSSQPVNPVDPGKFVKIYRYLPDNHRDIRIPPIDVDFSTALDRHLVRVRDFDSKGRLVTARFYADDKKDDLIVRIAYTYSFNAQFFPEVETRVFTWLCEDDTAHRTQKMQMIPFNDQLSKINKMEQWRSNQIRILKMRAIELLVYTSVSDGASQVEQTQDAMAIGRAFLAEHKIAFLNYVEDAHPDLINVLKTASDIWLDNEIPHLGMTIRGYLVEGLT